MSSNHKSKYPHHSSNSSKSLGICIGRINHLRIARLSPHGAYLILESTMQRVDSTNLSQSRSSGALYEVLLPKKFCHDQAQIGDKVQAFVYTDSLDRPVATTLMPLAQYGEVAFLRVVSHTDNGVFLDLGLDKDIFMPTKTPTSYPLDSRVAVYVGLDKSGRLIAKKDIQSHLVPYRARGYVRGTRVSIVPFAASALGVSVVVNGCYYGLVYLPSCLRMHFATKPLESTVSAMGLEFGSKGCAFIHNVRKDGKLDLVLHQRTHTNDSAQKLLQILRDSGGRLAVHYDSSPESIFTLLGMSKKALKRALSDLLAQKIITLTPQVGIELS